MFSEGEIVDGRYQIRRLIAAGGMGQVYLARRILLGDDVAIKVINTGEETGSKLRERFLQESRVCAALRHPHIVSILDFNIDPQGQPYLVMEYLNGPSLQQEIGISGAMELERVSRILSPICAALEVAHSQGIIHRDLKPANIVSHRYDSGEVIYKVVDFGLVNIRSSNVETAASTAPGTVLGTLAYASPEQLNGDATDVRSDVYSLGAVVYEMLTGRPPFAASKTLDLVMKHLTAEPVPPSSFQPGLPHWVDAMVLKALEKRPNARWQTALDFSRALRDPAARGTDSEDLRLPYPSLLGKYQLGRVLARGRFGSAIYEGRHRAMGHPVAVRLLRRQAGKNWEALRTRFLQEARNLQIPHPSIIQVRDYGEEGDIIYTVTDNLPGMYLRELLDKTGALPWERLRRMVSQLLDAIGALHKRGELVLGLSPDIVRIIEDRDGERLMVSSAGIWQVQDLLETVSESALRGRELKDAELHYVAPELYTGKAPDIQSDIYTVGLISYEMATGRRPFEAKSLPQLVGSMLRGEVRPPRELAPSLPERISASIVKCLEPEPQQRYEDIAQLAAIWDARVSSDVNTS